MGIQGGVMDCEALRGWSEWIRTQFLDFYGLNDRNLEFYYSAGHKYQYLYFLSLEHAPAYNPWNALRIPSVHNRDAWHLEGGYFVQWKEFEDCRIPGLFMTEAFNNDVAYWTLEALRAEFPGSCINNPFKKCGVCEIGFVFGRDTICPVCKAYFKSPSRKSRDIEGSACPVDIQMELCELGRLNRAAKAAVRRREHGERAKGKVRQDYARKIDEWARSEACPVTADSEVTGWRGVTKRRNRYL